MKSSMPGTIKECVPGMPSGMQAALLAVILLALSALTLHRNVTWGDELALWSDTTSKSPGLARPFNNLGIAYEAAGDTQSAMAAYREAMRLNPRNLLSKASLAVIYGKRGDVERAIDMLEDVVSKQPGYYKFRAGLGVAYLVSGRLAEAERELEAALELNDTYALAHGNLAIIYRAQGMKDKERKHREAARALSEGRLGR